MRNAVEGRNENRLHLAKVADEDSSRRVRVLNKLCQRTFATELSGSGPRTVINVLPAVAHGTKITCLAVEIIGQVLMYRARDHGETDRYVSFFEACSIG